MTEYKDKLTAVAKAEDTYDLLNHIAWTDVVRPALEAQTVKYSKLLVAEALGSPLPGTLSREQVAGMCYGIQYITSLMESILSKGEKALKEINSIGVSLA
jgi:hypothetical protein